ncbi:MAG: ABC transporter permease [Candidatus Riflebacteria bacterium]|nr:ABC transporter permease [Candidatus Riflebacteria bacterium]
MGFDSLVFFCSEALTNLRRAGVMTFVTVSTIAVALLLMGTFLLATMNMEFFLDRLQEEAMVTAFLVPGTASDRVSALKLQVTGFEEVSDVTVVTPEAAARELFTDPADQNLLQIGLGEGNNPLPYTIRMKVRSAADLPGLLAKLKAMPQVESVGYGEEAFRQFQGLSQLLWIGSVLVIILLGLSSLFIVYNTVRLTLFMRREEVVIMKLVGATNWFIRWPFIIEGFIHGLLGAALALVLLLFGAPFIMARLAALVPFFTFDLAAAHLFKLSIKLCLMGIVLGISGSLLSLRDLNAFGREM